MELWKQRYFLLGIKGTGMSNLALLLHSFGSSVSGCDSAQYFATQEELISAGIQFFEHFDIACLDKKADILIYSSAYSSNHPLVNQAKALGMLMYTYPQFLALLSRQQDSYAVAGTHGKTTTTSVTAHLLSETSEGTFPFYSLYGSRESGSDATTAYGKECALFEACEYQDHFLLYALRGVLVTSIEWDHPDYFSDAGAVQRSFETMVEQIGKGGFLIYCADDKQASLLSGYAYKHRPDLTILSYGWKASGPFQIMRDENGLYCLAVCKDFHFPLTVAAPALVNDHIGAIVLALSVMLDRPNPSLYFSNQTLIADEIVPTLVSLLASKLITYPGCKGRTEVLLSKNGVTYIDDYAHHPSEIHTSLQQIRLSYPQHKILVIFCPHTASRTKALIKEFVQELSRADALIIQKTYASARKDDDSGDALARQLASEVKRTTSLPVAYQEDDEDVVALACSWLQERWLCITMGAGNNRSLIGQIAHVHRSKQ